MLCEVKQVPCVHGQHEKFDTVVMNSKLYTAKNKINTLKCSEHDDSSLSLLGAVGPNIPGNSLKNQNIYLKHKYFRFLLSFFMSLASVGISSNTMPTRKAMTMPMDMRPTPMAEGLLSGSSYSVVFFLVINEVVISATVVDEFPSSSSTVVPSGCSVTVVRSGDSISVTVDACRFTVVSGSFGTSARLDVITCITVANTVVVLGVVGAAVVVLVDSPGIRAVVVPVLASGVSAVVVALVVVSTLLPTVLMLLESSGVGASVGVVDVVS